MKHFFKYIFPVLCTWALLSCGTRKEELNSLAVVHMQMNYTTNNLYLKSKNKIRTIEKFVVERGNKPRELDLYEEAKRIHLLLDSTHDGINSAKDKLVGHQLEISDAEIYETYKTYYKKTRLDKDEILQIKNRILNFLKENSGGVENNIEEMNEYLNALDQDLPLSLQLIHLTSLQWELNKIEHIRLERLIDSLDRGEFRFNQKLFVRAGSDIVQEGNYYNAEVFLAPFPSNKDFTKEIKFQGNVIPTDSNGIATVTIPVTPGKFNKNGIMEKKWKASITIDAMGRDSVFNFDGHYWVKRICR